MRLWMLGRNLSIAVKAFALAESNGTRNHRAKAHARLDAACAAWLRESDPRAVSDIDA